MASFQAKIGQQSMRKIENKNYRSVSFLPDEQQKIKKKIAKKFKKLKNTIMDSILSQNRLGTHQKERK